MRNKIIISFFATALSFALQSPVYSIPTRWEIVEASLSDLLSSGWQLQGVSYNRVASQTSFGPSGTSVETYVFSLTRKGKYIVCTMDNPSPPSAKSAGCRSIN